MPLKNNRTPLYTTSSFVHHSKSIREFKLELQSGNPQFGSKLAIFYPMWPWYLMDDLRKQYGTSSILRQALRIASKPWVNSNWSYSPETLGSKLATCLSRVTLKFDRWPWKKIGRLFCTISSFVHHFKAISEFKLELHSRSAQFGSKLMIFLSRMTLKFDRWPWETTGHIVYATSSFLHHFVAIGGFKLELQSEKSLI